MKITYEQINQLTAITHKLGAAKNAGGFKWRIAPRITAINAALEPLVLKSEQAPAIEEYRQKHMAIMQQNADPENATDETREKQKADKAALDEEYADALAAERERQAEFNKMLRQEAPEFHYPKFTEADTGAIDKTLDGNDLSLLMDLGLLSMPSEMALAKLETRGPEKVRKVTRLPRKGKRR